MTAMHAEILTSLDELHQWAPSWNALWNASEATAPTLRAEHIAMWVEQFAPDQSFRAIVVREGDQFLAALPLVGGRVKNVLEAGTASFNSWSPNCDLLIDESCDVARIMDHVAAKIDDLPWPLIWLEGVRIHSNRWQEFQRAVERRDINVEVSLKYHVGMLPTTADWETLQKTWSKSLARNIGRQSRNLEKLPGFRFREESPTCPDEVKRLLKIGFEVEDRSWKGENGTSILRSPGMADYYFRQAAELASQGHLALVFLECDDGPISYEYAWKTKGVFHSFKVGYDPAFHKHSPGQVLMRTILKKSCEDPNIRALDCMGPMSPALQKWRPGTDAIGRIVTAPKSVLGSALVNGYKHLRGFIKRFSRG